MGGVARYFRRFAFAQIIRYFSGLACGRKMSAQAQNGKTRERNVHALERNYDGIIIGAGHHGLVLGAYLAKAGLESSLSSVGSTTAAV